MDNKKTWKKGIKKTEKKGLNIQLEIEVIDKLVEIAKAKQWTLSHTSRLMLMLALKKSLDKEL